MNPLRDGLAHSYSEEGRYALPEPIDEEPVPPLHIVGLVIGSLGFWALVGAWLFAWLA